VPGGRPRRALLGGAQSPREAARAVARRAARWRAGPAPAASCGGDARFAGGPDATRPSAMGHPIDAWAPNDPTIRALRARATPETGRVRRSAPGSAAARFAAPRRERPAPGSRHG